MKQNKTLKKLYEFKQFLEDKIALYKQEIICTVYRLADDSTQGEQRDELQQDFADWNKMKNQAEAALVFVKSQIIFEER